MESDLKVSGRIYEANASMRRNHVSCVAIYHHKCSMRTVHEPTQYDAKSFLLSAALTRTYQTQFIFHKFHKFLFAYEFCHVRNT